MKQKVKLILFLFVLFLLVNTVTDTYAKYVSSSTGEITTQFARWQISVNNTNITQNTSSSITFTPTMDTNANVASGKIAPGSTGYFDIEIDPSNVDVSFNYAINITKGVDADVADLIITDYAIFDPEETNPTITKVSTDGSNITNTLMYDNNTANFAFDNFTVRIFFMWDDSVSATMNDEADTAIGLAAANNETIDNDYTVSISFSQYIAN